VWSDCEEACMFCLRCSDQCMNAEYYDREQEYCRSCDAACADCDECSTDILADDDKEYLDEDDDDDEELLGDELDMEDEDEAFWEELGD